jgi:hypothetical protein
VDIFSKSAMLFLLLGIGIGWAFTYSLIVYRSIKDKTYGMPFTALAFNICWEFLYGFILIPDKAGLQTQINRIWFFMDVLIILCYFLFGKKEWTKKQTANYFIPFSLFTIVSAGLLIYYYDVVTGTIAITNSAFMINVIISALFIEMLLKRNSLSGQSFGIAIWKCIGTLCATIYLFSGFSTFLQLLGILCFILDIIYIIMIIDFYKKENRNLFTRKIKG